MARYFTAASEQYLERTASVPITGPPFSVSAWFYATSAAYYTLLNLNNSSSSTNYHWLLPTSSVIRATSRDSGGSQNAETTASWSTSTWNHTLGVWASTTSRAVYLNGGNKGTDTASCDPGTLNRMRVSSTWVGGYEDYMDGAIAEMAIWSAALTDAEAAILALGISPLLVRPASLVAYWPMIRDTDRDLVGDYHWTPYNSPTIATHPPKIRYPRLAAAFILAAASAGGFTDRGIGRGILRGLARGL